jgi:hypothetical protein
MIHPILMRNMTESGPDVLRYAVRRAPTNFLGKFALDRLTGSAQYLNQLMHREKEILQREIGEADSPGYICDIYSEALKESTGQREWITQ